MEVDHGAIQPLEILLSGIETVPAIPVFVNGVAKPFVRMRRVRQLGEAIGGYLASLENERILVIGSGGLSHDPPVPQVEAPGNGLCLRARSRAGMRIMARAECRLPVCLPRAGIRLPGRPVRPQPRDHGVRRAWSGS
ncbi:hypothetical protein [Streptomyces sp. NBC_00059]|uniref:DODA-type extradiol aromatic ring-opening family dioxygenase n=1 Tax=Streptomyces sp. NBC_00059 TaxID=2975635 RepID=UPI002B1E7660|nr:hypothetical protein [Streptomyces sp. NBC_00059]